MTSYSFGDVVLVPFPFTDLAGVKKRPAVVVSPQAYQQNRPDIIMLAVTSRLHTPLDYGENLLHQWKEAGLLKPSSLKPVLFTLVQVSILRQLGTLGKADLDRLHDTLRQLVAWKSG